MEPICNCTVCGKPLFDGDKAYATTGGTIEESVDGFMMDDIEPWFTVACESCGLEISGAITNIQKKKLLTKEVPT